MRSVELGSPNKDALKEVDLSESDAKEMYRLLAIAKYEERYVIPKAHKESALDPYSEQGLCGYEQFKEAVPELKTSVKIRLKK